MHNVADDSLAEADAAKGSKYRELPGDSPDSKKQRSLGRQEVPKGTKSLYDS